jgi:hypothetical protein
VKAAERIRAALASACPCGDHPVPLNLRAHATARCRCATCRIARTSYQLNGHAQ